MAEQQIIDSNKIASGILIPEPCPRIILGIYPCRSASTKDLRVFAANGIPSVYQPLKTRQRLLMDPENPQDIPYALPDTETVFIKETIGYNEADSRIDPLEILLAAGVPPEQIDILMPMREPLATVTSWLKQFSFNGITRAELVTNAIESYKTVDAIRRRAIRHGIPVHSMTYEALRDYDPETVYSKVFTNLGLPFTEDSLHNWQQLPSMGELGSNISFPAEPIKYRSTSDHPIHATTESSDGPRYMKKSDLTIDQELSPDYVQLLERSPIFNIYDRHRKTSARQLDITLTPSREREAFWARHRYSIEGGAPVRTRR